MYSKEIISEKFFYKASSNTMLYCFSIFFLSTQQAKQNLDLPDKDELMSVSQLFISIAHFSYEQFAIYVKF